ncbi:PTS sugar transporter subunit IIC [Brevibacillus fluminis]|uniref:PTS sugar transporter subunit IIC n=1 Tax=Brevibacillus fluminis TaxID=511487 RepID=A0A3M8DSC4_9BACL|nr:PTS sugar transporter subunit IIC [Brevibacillus fluminis]RNB90389.1 PTS sugar transporter subunit IIC [Brevibacillus fluminis]
MLLQALLIGIIAGFGILDSRILGDNMLGRPIIIGPLVGLVLGDLQTGIIIGGTLELIFIGAVQVGAAGTGDVVTAAALGTSFAIMSNQGAAVALTLAVPVALLADRVGDLVRIINTPLIHRADKYAEEGNLKGVERMHRLGFVMFFLNGFLPTFIMLLLGSAFMDSVIKAMPQWLLDGLLSGALLLPAIGFSLLMSMMISKKLAPFYALGFILAAYLKLDILAVAIIGAIIALILAQYDRTDEERVSFNE